MRDVVQQTIDSLHNAIDETKKADSIKRIEKLLDRIDTEILDAEIITGLDDLQTAIEDYKGIERAGLTPEEYQDEKEAAFETIQEAVERLDIDEDALESLEAPPVKETWQMTREEWLVEVGYKKSQGSRVRENWLGTHEGEVRVAIQNRKPVPPEVLKDYPGLVTIKPGREPARKTVAEMESSYSREQIKEMALKKGVSTAGSKREIIRRLIE